MNGLVEFIWDVAVLPVLLLGAIVLVGAEKTTVVLWIRPTGWVRCVYFALTPTT